MAMGIKTILCIFAIIFEINFANAARRNPLKDPKICGRPQCEPDTNKFGYTNTLRYKYDYTMHIRSEFIGTGQNSSDLYVKAKIDLTFPMNCEGVLRIDNVEIMEKEEEIIQTDDFDYTSLNSLEDDDNPNLHSKSKILAKNLEEYELRFAFQDGAIQEICPNENEPIWVINFKKGILSSFQNTMLRFDVDLNTTETDVSGTCNVIYTLEGAQGTSVIIKKVKNIQTCRNRHQMHSVLQTTPYSFRDDKAIWPILNSQSYCNLTVDHNIYKEINCFERHQLIPFSRNETGAVTQAFVKFELTSDEETYSVPDFFDENKLIIKKRSSLLFDHTPTPKPTHEEIKVSRELLKKMCQLGAPYIQREFIDVFTKFLQTARILSHQALTQLLSRASSICIKGKDHVLESLPYIGTSASIQLMKDQLVGNSLTKEIADSWMTTLSFIPRPDEQTLETFYELIEYGQKKIDPEYTLGSTAVIHTYCRYHSDCETNQIVKKIINLLETEFVKLLEKKNFQRHTKERLIVILKGLGNIGIMSDNFIKKLKEMIWDEKIPEEIHTYAVLSFRRTNCNKHKDFFLDVYQNFTVHSEPRIFSYIHAMRCPDYLSVAKIKKVLETEEVNQVGSFVWSHLNNLAKSASPVRVEAQGLLTSDDLGTKYRMDLRKFSRNFEHSLFFDEYNFGTATDANLIFGADSFIPRFGTLNFTADLFGESINFFEISARAQGFEKLLASTFGPKGPLNADAFKKKFSFLYNYFGDEDDDSSSEDEDDFINFEKLRLKRKSNKTSARYSKSDESTLEESDESMQDTRNKRSAANSQDILSNDVDNLGYKLKYNYNEPRAAFGLKVFGNDLKYITWEGYPEVMAAAQKFNPFTQIARLLSGKEITYSKSGVFLDASYDVPLITGLPLSIHAFGASSIDLRMSGNLKLKDHTFENWNFDIEGKLKPSVSVEVITTMQSDFFYANSGIRVKSNLYSSSSVEAQLKVRGTQLVSLTLSLPQDKNQIFSAKSELLVLKELQELPQPGIEKRYANSTCTWPILDLAIGLKMCSNYSLPDVSNSTETYPALLLTGPIDIDVYLEKADPSAKTFVFEYRWDQMQDMSVGSFIFETPGSNIPRILTAKITKVPQSVNVSIDFKNGNNSHSAIGLYSSNPDDRRLDVFLHSNGKNYLALEMNINRTATKNGWTYYPRFLLTISDDKIAGLAGSVTVTEKKGIIQNDVSLIFETKRLQARIVGYITKTELSYLTKLKVDYRFQENEIESVDLEAELSNRSQKSRIEYKGHVKLLTTAYPKMNFASNITWLSVLGHHEGKLTYNNAIDFEDPNYTTTLRIILARSQGDETKHEGYRTKIAFEVIRPISNIDYRILLKHEERFKVGPVHNILGALRYAPQKEATAFFSIYFPKRNLFAVDASMKITIPSFDSCSARLQVVEKNPKDYAIDFNGAWFTGHSISAKGFYADKSSRIKSHHQIKLMVKSPSFEDTAINIIYRRNSAELLTDVQVEYGKSPYGLTIKYTARDENQKNTYVEVKLIDKLYWLSAKLITKEYKLLNVEIHLDKTRDIHLAIKGYSTRQKKEILMEVKWDANRDPTQVLSLLANFNNPEYKKFNGHLTFTYPYRTLSGSFDFYTGGPHYEGTARASWGPNDMIIFNYNAGLMSGEIINNWFHVDLKTPFEGWKENLIEGGIYNADNLLLLNTSIVWAETQNIAFIFKGNYEILDPEFRCELRIGLNSSIQDVPTISAYLVHHHDFKELNTDAEFRYKLVNESLQIYSLKSDWKLGQEKSYKNIIGSVTGRTPFEGYKTGALITKFQIGNNKDILGAAALNFEERKFTMALEGYVKKLTDNMLQINITTPIERFKTINGRFGLNERERHAVAEIRAPAGALGAEILFAVQSFTNFDIKLSLATPLEAFQSVLLIGKMKPETIDLRGGWNNITVGFTGIWSFKNTTNFEYSYQIFTPVENFKENGIVIKLLKLDEFIVEIYGKMARYKAGIKLYGKPKPLLISKLTSKGFGSELFDDDFKEIPIVDEIPNDEQETENEDYENEEDEDDELLNYIGYMELDLLVLPTITGDIDIEERGDNYITIGKLELPQGRVDIKDILNYPDMLNVNNLLKIKTPFQNIKEVKSKFEYSIQFKHHYISGFEISYLEKEQWTDLGYFVNYTITSDENDSKCHDIKIILKTPLAHLEKIEIFGLSELEENVYKGNFTVKTKETHLSLGGSLESEGNYLDAAVGFLLKTPVVPYYACHGFFKKDFSEIENSIDLGIDVTDEKTNSKFQIETKWHVDGKEYINGNARVHTNILPLRLLETSVLITKVPNPIASFDLIMIDVQDQRTTFHGRASRKDDIVDVELTTPMQDFRNITLIGKLRKLAPEDPKHKFTGTLYRNTISYSIDGDVIIIDELPVTSSLRLKSTSGGPDGIIEFSIKNTEGNYGTTFEWSAVEDGRRCHIAGGYSKRNHFDWDLQVLVQSTEPEISRISLSAKMQPSRDDGKMSGDFNLETPWTHLGLGRVHLATKLDISPTVGKIESHYELDTINGKGICSWSWILLENMQLLVESHTKRYDSQPRIIQLNTKYINPRRNFQNLHIGGKLNVDELWIIDANGTLELISLNDVTAGLIVQLPKPIGNTHYITGIYRGNLLGDNPIDVSIEFKYENDVKKRFITRGLYKNVKDLEAMGRIEWGPIYRRDGIEGNLKMLRQNDIQREFLARVLTPYYQKEDTLVLKGDYDYRDIYHFLKCNVNFPESIEFAKSDISFSSLSNMKGYVNSTTPFKNLEWIRGDFNFLTTMDDSKRFLKATWPSDTASFNLNSQFKSEKLDRDITGIIDIDVPLATRHKASIDYSVKERELLTLGHANVIYNEKKVLKGLYTCKSEESAGFSKDSVDITVENDFKPIGIVYIHSKDYTIAERPDYDMKHVEIYELQKNDSFNITGELHIKSSETGQDYKIVAIHPNRTVILTSDYDYQERITKQKSKLELSPTAWIGYNLQIENQTTITEDSQNFKIDFSYPKRTLSVFGSYKTLDGKFNSDLSFKWLNSSTPEKMKVISAALLWRNETLTGNDKDKQTTILTISHPSFTKDATFTCNYYRNPTDLFRGKMVIDYSTDPEHLITFDSVLRDISSEVGYRNYTMYIFAKHNISSLILDVKGTAGTPPQMYKIDSTARYLRSYFSEKNALFLFLLDLKNKSIDYHRESPYKTMKVWFQPYGTYPIFGLNGTVIDSPELNSTGFVYIDLDNKFTRMEINLTQDASQNVQMIGAIPDARNGYFDLWRNYDEIRVIDITSYLRMNHSRLITGQFHWRPKLKNDIKKRIQSIGTSFYDTFSDAIDFWIKQMYNEVTESFSDIWLNAKPEIQGFLDDLNDLSILEEDLEDFRIFVNQSYEANDFYIKDVVNFTLTVLDELALRDSIESLPKIFREIWQVMGDSGQALRKSIIWFIETIRTTYHKAIEVITKFLHGESFQHLSILMEKAIEKYDKFIKDLHLSFIKYVQNLWNRFTNVVTEYWKAVLKRIEPHIFRFLHYIETALWNISKEIFDFINKRTNELAESPYFNKVSSFTQDLDILYRDIQSNDAITNFKKYSKFAWDFIKEKYFKIVPFGKELHEVLTELWEEIKELEKVESIHFVIQKYKELEAKLEWLAEELELENRIHQLYHLIRNKITRLTQTALQNDDKYREAKTKFIFDPEVGVIDLEQKLPMSWHAFNETPKFEEIPEYKLLVDVQNFFSGTNFSIMNFLYTIKNNMDPNMWFPPYKSHSLLIGSRYIMTFDKKFISLNYDTSKTNQCSYLLAHDFFNRNFTLILEPYIQFKNGKSIPARKLILLTQKGSIVQIDVTGDNLEINNNKSPTLPTQIDNDLIISKDSDVLLIESDNGFNLQCNLMYDLCWFELSGWYFGQTAGILGTMNNEHFDDFTTSTGLITRDEHEFINSWSLRNCIPSPTIETTDNINTELCSEFFRTSIFETCFDILNPDPFYEMCIGMGSNSVSKTVKSDYPVQKEACTSALAYIEACSALKIPLRIPDQCVHCSLINGTYVNEGTFIEMKDNEIPKTSDIVFIVEAKQCNKDLTHQKNIMAVVSYIENQLEELNITNNRFSVFTFGGLAPFDKPRSVVHNNKIFTNADNLKSYFDHIETSNGTNNDIFQAISVASKLIFRPGASKTFVLLPCSGCASHDMKFDYSSLLQLMLEEGITLHILMDDGFVFDKSRLTKKFFGMDRDYAYEKDDFEKFQGNAELRKQVRLPKEGLRLCIPLAIETNGAIFTTRKLRPDKKNPIKKFAAVFAKRVAKTAIPKSCQTCECSGHNNGIPYMVCTSCDVPNPVSMDYEFDENISDFTIEWEDDETDDV